MNDKFNVSCKLQSHASFICCHPSWKWIWLVIEFSITWMYLDSDAAFFFKLSLHLSLDVFSYLLIFNRSLLFGCLSLQLIFLLSRCLRIFVSVWSWASYHILLLLKSFVVEEGGLIVSYSNCDSKVVRNEVEIGLTERWLINAAKDVIKVSFVLCCDLL